jgi:hypothetical protein
LVQVARDLQTITTIAVGLSSHPQPIWQNAVNVEFRAHRDALSTFAFKLEHSHWISNQSRRPEQARIELAVRANNHREVEMAVLIFVQTLFRGSKIDQAQLAARCHALPDLVPVPKLPVNRLIGSWPGDGVA